jgi:putative drug exporter of the RND superfamily
VTTIAPATDTTHASEHAPTSLLGRLATLVLHHRKLVLVGWLVILVAGGMSAARVSSRLSVDFSLPGQPGYETGLKILHTFGNGGTNTPPAILVVTVPSGQSVATDRATLARGFDTLRQEDPSVRVVDYASTGDREFVTNDGRSTFAYVFEPLPKSFAVDSDSTAAQHALEAALPGYQVGLTGLNQLAAGGSTKGPGVLAETMFGGLGALAVLAFVFASLLALLPLVIATVAILATFLVILVLTYITDVSFIVEFLVALVGLGIAIDYSLLLVTRWREERARGLENHAAVVRAVETAGRAVLLSGLTVAIGLVALVVLPVPGLRSTGIGGMLIPLISIFVVLTLLPALLGGIGPRVDWPRIRHEHHASRGWSRWAHAVTRRRFLAMGVATVILVLSIIPIFGLKVGDTSADALSKTGSARVAYDLLVNGGVPSGVLTPMEILTSASAAPSVVSRLADVKGVRTAALASGRSGTIGGLSVVVAIPEVQTVNNTTLVSVSATEAALRSAPGVVGVSGLGPVEQDYSHAVFGNFPLMFSLIALLTFLLLARAFRSIVLAAKAVVLNLVSLAATFGLLTWFWQEGHGSKALFNIPATGAITFWIPLMVFAFLFGLSMDYEVFILSRVREEYDRSGDTRASVVEGIGRTGRLVTSAALILFLAFASLASAPDTDIKVLATGLGAGILFDATVVRALLVPALVSVLGKWNWYMPGWFARVLLLPAEAPRPQD